MSERIVNDPSQHGWVEVDGKWVWDASGGGSIQDGDTEGQITTWDGTEWTPTNDMTVNSGIMKLFDRGSGDGELRLFHEDNNTFLSAIGSPGSVGTFSIRASDGGTGSGRLTIDANGNVGVGGTPGTRSTKEIEDDAVSTLANWKTQIDDRLKAEPKADKKAVTLEITGEDKLPTKAELIKRLTERNIGGGTAKLQVAGDGYFSGTVNAQKFVGDGSGLTGISAGGAYVPLSGNSTVSGTITATDFIATSDERLKDSITPLPVGLIDDIKPVQWSWKDGSGKSAGVIAQQLQSIGLDDFVNEDAEGNLGVNYNALVGVLLAEVISLKAEVESLK